MRMSDNPALRDYDDYYIGSILRGEGTAFLVDQGILFAAYDALGHDALDEEVSRTRQIDHWLGSDFDGVIMFGERDAVQHAAGEESERCAHDNLNAVPQAASGRQQGGRLSDMSSQAADLARCLARDAEAVCRRYLSLSETHARIYWWCRPPKMGTANV